MSLDTADVAAIRNLFNEAFEELIVPRFDDQDDRLSRQTLKLHAVKNELSEVGTKVDAGLFAVNQSVEKAVKHIDGRVDALEADIKELYKMIAKLERGAVTDKRLAKLSVEKRILLVYKEVKLLAGQNGITLPR